MDSSPCSQTRGRGRGRRTQGSAELVAQRGQGVLALLPLPWRDLDPQALCYQGSDKYFKARKRQGGEEKLEGEGAPFLCTEASVTAPTSGAASLGAEAPCHGPVPPLVLASLAGHLPRQKSRGRRRRKDSGARPATALPAESGGRQRQDTQGKGGRWRSSSPRGAGWALFLLLSLPRGGSLADFLDQLLIRQAVEAVDGQVRDEVLTGFAGDLFATPQVNEGDVGDAAQVQQGLVRQLIAACGQNTEREGDTSSGQHQEGEWESQEAPGAGHAPAMLSSVRELRVEEPTAVRRLAD